MPRPLLQRGEPGARGQPSASGVIPSRLLPCRGLTQARPWRTKEPGDTAAPVAFPLWLLPSGPDQVRGHRRAGPGLLASHDPAAARAVARRAWRRGRDSNPRYGYPYTRFPSVLLRPLGHLSALLVQRSQPRWATGGEGGIRTHGPRKGSTVFETVPIDHSGTSPHRAAKFTLARELAQRPRRARPRQHPRPGGQSVWRNAWRARPAARTRLTTWTWTSTWTWSWTAPASRWPPILQTGGSAVHSARSARAATRAWEGSTSTSQSSCVRPTPLQLLSSRPRSSGKQGHAVGR